MAPDRTRQSWAVPGDSLSRQEQSALRRFNLAEGALMLSLGTSALIADLSLGCFRLAHGSGGPGVSYGWGCELDHNAGA
jgi:hypothetical protein